VISPGSPAITRPPLVEHRDINSPPMEFGRPFLFLVDTTGQQEVEQPLSRIPKGARPVKTARFSNQEPLAT